MSRARKGLAVRIAVAAGLLFLLGGPTPGSVGSCSETDRNVANAPQFCVDKLEGLCRRTRFVCLRTMDAGVCNMEYTMCTSGLIERCTGASWPGGCTPPTQAEADACIGAIRSSDPAHLAVPNDEVEERFPECMQLQCTPGAGAGLLAPDGSAPMTEAP